MVQYWLDLFTPQTWEEARKNEFKLTGFREGRWSIVQKMKPGDLLICYLTKISRFCGILKVTSEPYKSLEKSKQVWKGDAFPCVMEVKPILTLDFLHSVPTSEVISKLTIAEKWGGIVRGSPNRFSKQDGDLISNILKKSHKANKEYPLTKKVKILHGKNQEPKKQVYGAPIDFRGLRHVPLNEQGVVYLFALISKDLGFTVEAIGQGFPDCEAMRQIDSSGKWQRLDIEFEYKSSNFKQHGHSVEGCDLIVCWIHDWKECPLEVIELREEIEKLGALKQ